MPAQPRLRTSVLQGSVQAHVSRCGLMLAAATLLVGCANVGPGTAAPPASYDTGAGAVDGVAGQDTTAVDTGAVDSGAPDTGAPHDAGKDAGVPSALSCQGKCGAKYNPTLKCQCNDDCGKFGNCCADYGPLCKPETASCKGRCDEPYDKSATCQCTWDCSRYGTCCGDYLDQCHPGAKLDFQVADPGETAHCNKPSNLYNVEYAKDGDTLQLIDGSIVRFLVVNTPELSKKDCYATNAHQWTKSMVKKVKTVCLIMDPAEGDKDQYDRLLRYVYYKDPDAGGAWVNMNLRLVSLGLGPVFYPYAADQKWEKTGLLMQERARIFKIGGWGVCGWK